MARNYHFDHLNKASNLRYELIIKQQPQHCQASGFGEKDKFSPINPTPIVQLLTYQGNQLIEPNVHDHPPCILHVSLWSKNQTQPLDMVHVVHNNEKTPTPTTPVRAMVGTLSNMPLLLYDQQRHLGVYFSFPDIGVRVASTYCLKFDLVFLTNEFLGNNEGACAVTTHIYSDPFVVYTANNKRIE